MTKPSRARRNRPEYVVPPPVTLEGLPDVVTIKQAAVALHLGSDAIRNAITRGDLDAFTAGGLLNGRGMGYRIVKAELVRWYTGQPKAAP